MTFYIKPDKNLDFYVEWSGVVDSPVQWGPLSTHHIASERLERCNVTGTSIKDGDYGWDDEDSDIIVHELGTQGNFWLLPINKMVEFFAVLNEGNVSDPIQQDKALNACCKAIQDDLDD